MSSNEIFVEMLWKYHVHSEESPHNWRLFAFFLGSHQIYSNALNFCLGVLETLLALLYSCEILSGLKLQQNETRTARVENIIF